MNESTSKKILFNKSSVSTLLYNLKEIDFISFIKIMFLPYYLAFKPKSRVIKEARRSE